MDDWIKDDMRESPQEIVVRLGKLLQGSISAAIANSGFEHCRFSAVLSLLHF
ncbi:MAG: TetR-like C-terminal domain-containing protein [Ruminococcus sp.]